MSEIRQLNIRLDEELAEQLKVMAAEQGLSLNRLIVRVLQAAAEAAEASGTEGVTARLEAIEKRLDALEGRG